MRLAVLALISALALGGLFLILRPDQPAAAPARRSFDLKIQGESMDPEQISVREGDRVIVNITSDHPVGLHVHGYDLEREVDPGEAAGLSFEANLTGRFPVEDHEMGTGLGALVVEPR